MPSSGHPRGDSNSARKRMRWTRSGVVSFFVRGLATLLPVVLTVFVFVTLFQFINSYLTGPINRGLYWALEGNGAGWGVLSLLGVDPYDPAFVDVRGLPLDLRDAGEKKGWTHADFVAALSDLRARREGFLRDLDALCVDAGKLRAAVQKRVHPLFGVVLSLALVLWLGWVTGGFVGRQVLGRMESALLAVPGIRAVYPYTKRLVDFFLTEKNRGRIQFKSVALVRYPSERVWTLAFVTNRAPEFMAEAAGLPLVTVFVPSSPIPMTGYTVNVPEDSVVYLPMSVDEALRVVVSGGVLTPAGETLTAGGEAGPGKLPGGEPPDSGPSCAPSG